VSSSTAGLRSSYIPDASLSITTLTARNPDEGEIIVRIPRYL
jgi:hypothetical protein